MPSDYEAVVYDLDGTLVELDVDWDEVRAECAAVVRARGVDPRGRDLWEMLDLARAKGFQQRLSAVIAEFEREGARTSTLLPAAEKLPRPVPVGVCSLNALEACRVALELHGLDCHVDVVVGRNSVDEVKPEPEPLLRVIEGLDARPDRTLFVGDSESDEECASRAGVDFRYVSV